MTDAREALRGATKIVLDEAEMPTQWYNLVPDLPSPPPPVLHPGTLQPVGPDDLAPLFPMELIGQEVTGERYVDIPGAVLDVYRLWRPSPLYRAHRLEKALGYARADLLQVRGRLAGRFAQAQHGGAAGVLQRSGRHPPADDRDRRRPVGHRAGVRLRAVRARVRGVAGAGVLRPEALSADDDRDVRRGRPPVAVDAHRGRPGDPGDASRLDRLARHRDQRGGRGGRAERRHELRARQRAQPRAAAPDRHR